jgi:hypothetical protein
MKKPQDISLSEPYKSGSYDRVDIMSGKIGVGHVKYKVDGDTLYLDMIRIDDSKSKGKGYAGHALDNVLKKTKVKVIVPTEDGYSKEGDEFMSNFVNKNKERVRRGDWATEFMEKYKEMGISNFVDPRDRIIDGVQVNLSDYVEGDKVVKVWTVLSRYQGKGQGSQVLEKLKALADETKTSIVLKPGKWGIVSTLSVPQLKEWYMRHGFKEMKHGWLIYTPKGVTVKVDLNKRLGEGFWNKKAKRKSLSKPRAGRMK